MQSASRKMAYLTVDDAPTADFARKVDYLASRGVPTIFFCNGDKLEQRRAMAVDAISRGFVLGNHTYAHFCDFRDHAGRSEQDIVRTEMILDDLYREAGIARPAKLFRFPGLEKGVPGWPYYAPVKMPSPEVQEVRERAQAFLRSIGVRQPQWQIRYHWYHDYANDTDVDCDCTYDSWDYGPLLPNHPFGYNTMERVLARTNENVPEDGRGLNDPRSDEIIMVHDIEEIAYLFVPLVERLLTKPMTFALPVF